MRIHEAVSIILHQHVIQPCVKSQRPSEIFLLDRFHVWNLKTLGPYWILVWHPYIFEIQLATCPAMCKALLAKLERSWAREANSRWGVKKRLHMRGVFCLFVMWQFSQVWQSLSDANCCSWRRGWKANPARFLLKWCTKSQPKNWANSEVHMGRPLMSPWYSAVARKSPGILSRRVFKKLILDGYFFESEIEHFLFFFHFWAMCIDALHLSLLMLCTFALEGSLFTRP